MKAKRNIRIVKSVCKALYYTITVGLMLWIGWSVLEVWIHNATMLNENPYQYSSFNMFTLLM